MTENKFRIVLDIFKRWFSVIVLRHQYDCCQYIMKRCSKCKWVKV